MARCRLSSSNPSCIYSDTGRMSQHLQACPGQPSGRAIFASSLCLSWPWMQAFALPADCRSPKPSAAKGSRPAHFASSPVHPLQLQLPVSASGHQVFFSSWRPHVCKNTIEKSLCVPRSAKFPRMLHCCTYCAGYFTTRWIKVKRKFDSFRPRVLI